jgi:hypothetical protein
MNRTWLLIVLIGGLFLVGTQSLLQAQQTSIPGLYVNLQGDRTLQLNLDGSLSLHETNGQIYSGQFTVNGDTLTLTVNGLSTQLSIRGDRTLYDANKPVWFRQKGAPVPAAPPPARGTQQTSVAGLYLYEERGSQLRLYPDGLCSLHSRNGEITLCRFTVNGDMLVVTYESRYAPSTYRIQGNNLYHATTGAAFVRQGDAPAPAEPPVAPLKLPALYVNAQNPVDKLQLNADNSLSLQEGGQTYQGTFVASGNTLELNIRETATKNTLTRQGNDLTSSDGQTWTWREQSTTVETAPSAAVLQNEDIIKLVKVGIDDATIIAKISSSKCQFDTSTDALIQLKKSGVKPAVLKAMVGSGK